MNYIELLFIGLGGSAGSIARFLALEHLGGNPLVINLVGSFCLGSLNAIPHRIPVNLRLPLTVGFLGGFTTFSGFIAYVGAKPSPEAIVGAGGSLLLGLVCCWGGSLLVDLVRRYCR